MKKLFLYTLLGLLWCNVAVAEIFTVKCKQDLWIEDSNHDFNHYLADEVATLIIDTSAMITYEDEDFSREGKVTLIFRNKKTDYIIKKFYGKYGFTAYEHYRFDSKDLDKNELHNADKLWNLNILKMEPDYTYKPNTNGTLYIVDLHNLHELSNKEYNIAEPNTNIQAFICADKF